MLGSSSGTTKLRHKATGDVVWLSNEEADVGIFDAPELSLGVEKLIADAERSCEHVNKDCSTRRDIDRER